MAYILNLQIYSGMVDNRREIELWTSATTLQQIFFFILVPLSYNLLEKKLTLTSTLIKIIFMKIIDMAALNVYLLWTQKYPEWKKNNISRRKCFIRELFEFGQT